MNRNHELLDEFEKLENSFYNIDSGLIQHPDLVVVARALEYFKQCIVSTGQEKLSSISNDFIDNLQLQQLSNTK
jgi:hypothetical protein